MADAFFVQDVRTATDGDVVVKISDGTDTALVTAGGRLQVEATASGTGDVNLIQIGGNSVDVGSGTGGSATQRVDIDTATVLSIDDNGSTLSIDDGAGSITVDDGGTPLQVTFEGAIGTLFSEAPQTSASLAAGATVRIDTADITNTTGKLLYVMVASAQPIRVDVGTTVAASFTAAEIYMQEAYGSEPWRTPERDHITETSGAGRTFSVEITNLDNNKASDVHATFVYEEV